MLVDAKHERATGLNARYEFEFLSDGPLTLWLPILAGPRLFSEV